MGRRSSVAWLRPDPGGGAEQGVSGDCSAIVTHRPVRLFETMGIGSHADKLNQHGELTYLETVSEVADFRARFAEHCRTPID